jgi:hypothetical protein
MSTPDKATSFNPVENLIIGIARFRKAHADPGVEPRADTNYAPEL